MNTLIVDTNILISALIKDGSTRRILAKSKLNLLFPEFEFEEIKNHKAEIVQKAGLSEKEFDIMLLRLLNYVRIIPANISLSFKERAYGIIGKIDEDDVPFIATALAFNCPIWSDDKHFKKQNKIKILTTKDMAEYLS
jgi:predicted nucleic acid-binding protein